MENYTTYKPEWAPSDAGKEFACQVMSGIDEVGHPSEPGPARFVRKQYTVDDLSLIHISEPTRPY